MGVEMFLENITFYENLLSVRNIKLKLYAKLSQPRSLNVEADGIIALGKTDYAVKVGRDPATNKYALTANVRYCYCNWGHFLTK